MLQTTLEIIFYFIVPSIFLGLIIVGLLNDKKIKAEEAQLQKLKEQNKIYLSQE